MREEPRYGVDTWCILHIYKGDPIPNAQIAKWGNSLAIRIPKPVAEEAGMQEGDPIEVAADRGQISVRRKDRIPTLKVLVSQIADEDRYAETVTSPARGKEAVEW